MADAAEPGTIADTVTRMALWCRRADQSFIRAVFDDGRARHSVVRQLEEKIEGHGGTFHQLDLPAAASADALALRLAEELTRLGPGVVSLTGFELSLPTSGPALEAALLALNSRRENFAVPGQHTIWWFPRHIAQALIREHHDLNSWFLRRVELTETLSTPAEMELASLHHEGVRLSNAAAYQEAEPILRQVAASAEANFGADDPQLAAALINLAQMLAETNRLAEAERIIRRALNICETQLGSMHPRTGMALNNLALLLKETSRPADAERLLRRVLTISEEGLGPDHPNVATALNNLADVLGETGRSVEAKAHLRRALGINRAALGPHHPATAANASNLAGLLFQSREFEEAEQLIRGALAIHEESFGADHPKVSGDLNTLAQVMQGTDRQEEAEKLIRRALAIDEARLGSSHPFVANRLHNLAQFLVEAGRTREAESLLHRSLGILAASSAAAGHSVEGIRNVSESYRRHLNAMGIKKPEAERQMVELLMSHGLSRKKAKQLART